MTGPGASDADLKTPIAYLRDSLLIAALIIAGLYAGSGFLIPLTLAVLVFVLIVAVSDRAASFHLGSWRVPQWLGYILGSTTVLFGLLAVMLILGSQATQLARAIPTYETQMDTALARIGGLIGPDVVEFLRVNFIQIDMSRLALSAFSGAGSFFSTFLLICLYVAFMIGERAVMGRKILLATQDRKLRAEINTVSTEISASLQRYVGIKTFISALTGIFSYAVFRALGLEFAETWAVLTFALNFIPSIGSVLAVILPALVALVQFETITPFLIVVLGCGIVQFVIGNFIDPALTGRTLNLSTLMVILTLTFWTMLWGVIGAFLSVPLTVCVVIVFSQISATRPLAILMSKDGTLFSDIALETHAAHGEP